MPEPFIWDEANHIARTPDGYWIPSTTQVLELQHLSFNFQRFVAADVLDRRSKIGTEVHNLTDTYDEDGEVSPLWLTEETEGYLQSWIELRRISGFVPRQWSIRRCERINGMLVTGESDKEGTLGKHEAIIDLKTGSSASDSWGFQLASYEQLRFRSPKIGRVIRAVAHLQADGSPGKLLEYPDCSPIDGAHYGDAFLAALHCTHIAIRRGFLTEYDVM